MYRAFVAAAATAILTLSTPMQAFADASFLQRFKGTFSGGGTILRDVDPAPRRVSCKLAGTLPVANDLLIRGTCRAAIIFTRPIGAEIRFDPASNSFSGSYSASSTGPAALSNGTLQGNVLTLKITYAKLIYGDRNAMMTITNAGDGQLIMIVTDMIEGKPVQTSAIRLQR